MGNLCVGGDAQSQLHREQQQQLMYRTEAMRGAGSYKRGQPSDAIQDPNYQRLNNQRDSAATAGRRPQQSQYSHYGGAGSKLPRDGVGSGGRNFDEMSSGTDSSTPHHRTTVIHYHNGDRYEGQVYNDRRDGQGVYYCADKEKRSNYEYHGTWRDNLREGKGSCFYYNGDLFVGQWRAGKRHGFGELFMRRGDKYKGEWRSDQRDGKGTLTSANGAKYTGRFKQDKKHSNGEMVRQDGQVFEEFWQYGVLMTHTKKNTSEKKAAEPFPPVTLPASTKNMPSSALKKNGFSMSDNTSEISFTTEERYESNTKLALLLKERPEISEWTTDAEVSQWLEVSKLPDQIKDAIKSHKVNGQSLLQLNESQMESSLGIGSLGKRKNLMRQIGQLKAVAARNNLTALGQSTMNMSQLQQSLTLDQSLSMNQTLSKPRNERNSMPELAGLNRSQQIFLQNQSLMASQVQHLSFQMVNNTRTSSIYSTYLANQLQIKQSGHHRAKSVYSRGSSSVENGPKNIFGSQDPESVLSLGHDTGLFSSLQQNGFDSFITYKELLFDHKQDYIGGGGYGDVYKAKWLGTRVAVKRFGKRYLSRKALKDFIKEIEMLNQLSHPNIVLYMGVSMDPQSHFYMVTEYVSKGSLFELLHQKKIAFDDDKIMRVAKQVALALLYLHKRQLFHCDLKSQNVLIDNDWKVKLCDFGLSRYQDKFEKDNHGKIGTPHWMAPEILRGEKYTEAADVYSFGVILWEMITGDIPFMGRSIAQITGIVGYYHETLKVPTQCNKSLKKIVNNCMIYEPDRRPSFDHIVQYLDTKLTKSGKDEAASPVMDRLLDFLN